MPGSYLRSKAESFEYDANHTLKHNLNFCLRLHKSVQDPIGHFSRIDEAFAPVLVGRFSAERSFNLFSFSFSRGGLAMGLLTNHLKGVGLN